MWKLKQLFKFFILHRCPYCNSKLVKIKDTNKIVYSHSMYMCRNCNHISKEYFDNLKRKGFKIKYYDKNNIKKNKN